MGGREDLGSGFRKSGILLPLFSLPSRYGIGDLGPEAYRFVDFLASTGQSIWQVLPLNPVAARSLNSPYSSYSLFAGNPLFISPEMLYRQGYLDRESLQSISEEQSDRVNYIRAAACRNEMFEKAGERILRRPAKFDEFRYEQRAWLRNHSLFTAMMRYSPDTSWREWPSVSGISSSLKREIEQEEIRQFLFFQQWQKLKEYCNSKSISILGDIPIYADYESVDVWSQPQYFKLNRRKLPSAVSGVPPDYFSNTGQRWGNPVYRWQKLRKDGFRWWLDRLQLNFTFFDLIRLDHFRGFAGYWEIPASEKTAVNGRWVKGPGREFLRAVTKRFMSDRLIAEDLGHITADVKDLLDEFKLAGMRVLQVAFRTDPSKNLMAPHNHIENCFVYTGTHDNNTVRGWYEHADACQRNTFHKYIGKKPSRDRVHHEFVKLAMMSVAQTAIFPIQDILGLGSSARINTPSTLNGNWQWRLLPGQIHARSAEWFGEMTNLYGRTSNHKDTK